jgi:membrane-bound inhibitor of C-type lysozyme
MATSLLEGLRGYVTPQLLSEVSRNLGESEGAVSAGLGSSAATILAGLAGKASSPQGMAPLFDLITNPANDGSVLKDPRLLAAGTAVSSPLGSLGGSLLSGLFGSQLGSVGDLIGRSAGLRAGSGASLLSMAAPLVMGLLGNRVRSGGLNAAGLGSLLLGQKDEILRAAPAGLSSILGLKDIGRTATAAATETVERARPSWLWPALAALALIAVVWILRNATRSSSDQAVGAVTPALPAAFRCGDRSISIDQVDDRTVLTAGAETFTLNPVRSASGAKYEAEGDPATTFWSKGDKATLTIRGQTFPECTKT